MSLKQNLSEFDFIGLALLMAGAVCVLVGLNSGETSCASDPCARLSCIDDWFIRVIYGDNCSPFRWMHTVNHRLDQ